MGNIDDGGSTLVSDADTEFSILDPNGDTSISCSVVSWSPASLINNVVGCYCLTSNTSCQLDNLQLVHDQYGNGEVYIQLSDGTLTSEPQRLLIEVNNTDEAPSATVDITTKNAVLEFAHSPADGSNIAEDNSTGSATVFTLGYVSYDNENATSCDVIPDGGFGDGNTTASVACACSAGVCTVTMADGGAQGESDNNAAGPNDYFQYRVCDTGGLCSSYQTVQVDITPDNDALSLIAGSVSNTSIDEDDASGNSPTTVSFCLLDDSSTFIQDGQTLPAALTQNTGLACVASADPLTDCGTAVYDVGYVYSCTYIANLVTVDGTNSTNTTLTIDLDIDDDDQEADAAGANDLAAVTISLPVTVDAVNDQPGIIQQETRITAIADNYDEDNAIVIGPLDFDEGEDATDSDEDSQNLSITNIVSSDATKISPANKTVVYYDANGDCGVAVYTDQTCLTGEALATWDGTTAIDLLDSTADSTGRKYYLVITPEQDATAILADALTLTVTVTDSGSNVAPNDNTVDVTFANLLIDEYNDPPTISHADITMSTASCPYSSGGSDCDIGACTSTDSPVTLNVAASVANSIYYDSTNDKCYYSLSTTAGDWTEFAKTFCPISDASADATTCSGDKCIAAGAPAAAPTAAGTSYYNVSTDECYLSINTTATADWIKIHNYGTHPGLTGNENALLSIQGIEIDEGGTTGEDTDQTMFVFGGSDNTTLVANQNLKFYRGLKELTSSTTARVVTNNGTQANRNEYFDDQQDAQSIFSNDLTMRVYPVGGQFGTANIYLIVQDDVSSTGVALNPAGDPNALAVKIPITVYSIGALHGGWSNLYAKGDRQTREDSALGNNNTATIYLEWNNFTIAGSDGSAKGVGDNTTAGISGYNIYRREEYQDYDWSSPLNSSLITTNSYTDLGITTSKVYYYTVLPVDSINSNITYTGSALEEVKMVSPPTNMTYVHRWIMNYNTCIALGLTPDPDNSNRCDYKGPGDLLENNLAAANATYYDLRYSLLVDTYENGCPYTRPEDDSSGFCGVNGCIEALPAPGGVATLPTANVNLNDEYYFYDRSSGYCYVENGLNTWADADTFTFTDSSVANNTPSADMNRPELPPLVHVDQTSAYQICSFKQDLDIAGLIVDSSSIGLKMTLPSRKEQIAFSKYAPTLTDTNINSLESGTSLSTSTSNCNTSNAGTLSSNYVSGFPSSAFSYTIPGTDVSGIRSVVTGSTLTEDCSSVFGIQDLVGNVREWVGEKVTYDSASAANGAVGAADVNGDNTFTINGATTYTAYNFGPNAATAIGLCDDDGDADCTTGTQVGKIKIEESDGSSAQYFNFPMGLPIADNALTAELDGLLTVSTSGTGGISDDELHEDIYDINFAKADADGEEFLDGSPETGGMIVGGGFDAAKTAFGHSATDANVSYMGGNEAGIYSFQLRNEGQTSVDLGFRCLARVVQTTCNYSPPTAAAITSSACGEEGCIGAGAPPAADPGINGSVYLDSTNNICYYNTAAVWTNLNSDCPVSTYEQACDTGGAAGDTHCIAAGAPGGTAEKAGNYYLDTASGSCYVSTGSGATDWVEYHP